MRKVAPLLLLRLALLVAVFGCAVLVVEYEHAGDPAFCGVMSGCMAVRRSPYSRIADIPLPLLGLCAEAGLLALAVVARERSQTFFVAAAAAAGGLIGLVLMGLMAFKIGAFCKWCLLVDGSTVVAAVAAAWVHATTARVEGYEGFLAALSDRRAQIVAWAGGAALVAGLPFLWGEYPVVPPLPPAIHALSVPGKVTIVAFTDFECPFCRKLSPVVHEIQENWGDRMALVRKMVPLDGHPGAMPAALAYVCTPEAERDAMAKRLYTAPESVLNRDGMLVLAHELKLDEPRFARCFDGPAARTAIAEDKALFDALDVHALPYTYIGPRAVAGYNPDVAREVGRSVMDDGRPSLPVPWMLAAVLLVAAALAVLTVRIAPRARGDEPALPHAP